jgi:hypothetical protein
VDRGWRVTKEELDDVIEEVGRMGVVDILERRLGRRRDARRRLSICGYEVALKLNGRRLGHKAADLHLVRILNGLRAKELHRLGMPDWATVGSYDRLQRLHTKVAAALDEGWVDIDPDTGGRTACDWQWYGRRSLLASIPDDQMASMVGNVAIAVDGTEMESCGAFHEDLSALELDGDADQSDDRSGSPRPRGRGSKGGAKKTKVLVSRKVDPPRNLS